MAERKAACNDSVSTAKRLGLITSQPTPLRIIVDETTWEQLGWEQKKILLACLAIRDAAGGDMGDRIVSAYGEHSGKELAAGSPGQGVLYPSD